MRILFALLALPLFSLPTSAQGPAADWRTLATAHFRVHYPAASEAWTRGAAARLESIRQRVVTEVGYDPPEVVDVLVSDPVANPNGEAIPFLGWPRMILWTSPPGPESELGHYTDWSELLIAHEETHLVHLLRPSRNPARRLMAKVLPVGPIPLGAPRWVFEGYATVVEGRLTGSGRPNGDARAAVLRRWAQGGKLPSYARLALDPGTWRGMSMAYLLGSAYLEWLEERAGPGSLRKLWARMTARVPRGFDDAFRGVFGDSPETLYDRFRAELTWRAMEAERQGGPEIDGEPWQDLTWTTGAPAVSPDGRRLAIVLRSKDHPARLVVWPTAPDEEAETKWRRRREEIQKRDPEDVPAVRTGPLPRRPLYTLESHDGPEPTTPRWMPDGKSILFVRYAPDTEGFLHPDLFLWTPETGDVRRLTRGADLRDPDPAPDGRWAVATRNRDGASRVVRVDLGTAAVTPLTGVSIDVVYDRPRLSPDGGRVAFVRHREGSWRLVVQTVDGGSETLIAPPAEGTVSSPAWSADGRTLYAVVGLRGFIDLYAFHADGSGAPVPLTRTQGAALAPAPLPDGSALFFLSLVPDGFNLRRLPLAATVAAAPPAPELPRALAPAVPPPAPPRPEPFTRAEAPPGKPYGLGRQELLPFAGGSAAYRGGTLEGGLRGGDVLGRLDWLLLGSIGINGWPAGEALAVAWRGWPVEVGAHLFSSEERPTRTESVARRGNRLSLDRRGVEISASRDWQWSGGRLDLAGRALWDQVSPVRRNVYLDQRVGSLAAAWGGFRRWGLWSVEPTLRAHAEEGHTEEAASWSRWGGGARLGLAHDGTRLALSWRRDSSRRLDAGFGFDEYQLGGAETSLLPESALTSRIAVPALPVGTRLGTDHEGQRAELTLGFLPAPVFYERHRVWTPGGEPGSRDWLSLAGMEYRFNLGPLPIGRLPALDVRVGVARILEDPFGEFEGSTRWWLVTTWRP
ncbi:MAG TPA: LpqB family beta-propeller domain-containing protein [Thermoanaerobaculia bacterium]